MTRNPRRSFGRIDKRPSGRYGAAYIGPDKVLYRASQTFDARDDAVAWLSKQRAEISMGVWAADTVAKAAARSKVTFKTYAEKWMQQRDLKARTRQHYNSLLMTHIYPTFEKVQLVSISPDSISDWYSTLAIGKPTTKSHAYGLMRTILGSAVKDQTVAINPCHIRGAGRTKPVHKTRPASVEELEAIVSEIPDRYKMMTLLASWCAMRFGELTELRRKDIDLKHEVVRIKRAVVHVNGEFVSGVPKTAAGIRDVAIPPHLIPTLKKHLKDHTEAGGEALLFPAASGGYMAPSSLYKVFYKAREAAGRPDLRWHDLRHTGAVLAAQSGATLAELMGRLGHSTPGAAMRYQHTADGRDAEIAKRLSKMAEVSK